MYNKDQIENFLQTVAQNSAEIDKSFLKTLIEQNVDFRADVIRLVAEICKDETQRKKCVEIDMISSLKDALENGDIRNKIESCRAIGNMCYEHGDACEIVLEKFGPKPFFDLCRVACANEESQCEQLRMMTLGALHNMINSNEKVAERFLNENLLEIFRLYLPFLSEGKLLLFLFSIASNLVEHDTNFESLVSSNFLTEIGNSIDEKTLYENRKQILPFLLETCEEDRIKDQLCSSAFYLKLFHLCEEFVDKDDEFVRETCYILVVLITTDRSIELLIEKNHFDLLSNGLLWLEKSNLQLKMTGALIITNLTRNDQSATNIFSDSRRIDTKLVEQLKLFSNEQMTDERGKVAHGILGALRNLAVPQANRIRLAQNEVLSNLFPFLFVTNFNGEIAYKATGVLRFLLRDSIGALNLFDDRIIQKIVENSENSHAGLKFESRRVIFLLPVAFKNREIVEILSRNNALPIITSTLASCEVQSNRGIVQNEALIALNIVVMLIDDSICQKLKEANFHENLKSFLQQEVEHPEMMNNFLQLIHLIKKQPNLLSQNELHEYKSLLENLRVSQNCGGRRILDRTLTIIQNEIE